MNTIHRYTIRIADEQSVEMPEGAQIIHAGEAPNGDLSVWAKVDTTKPLEWRRLAMRGTGHPLPEDAEWVATFRNGHFMWHVFTLQ